MNSGSLLGGVVSFVLRASLTHDQLVSWGWRVPFVSGIFVSTFGFYLKSHGGDHDGHHYRQPSINIKDDESCCSFEDDDGDNDNNGDSDPAIYVTEEIASPPQNPLLQALSRENLRTLLASIMVPMLWSAGFYLSFVWMAIFMAELIEDPVPGAFAVNSASLFFSICLFFPIAGILSDRCGRVRIMTVGGTGMGILSPVLVLVIGRGNPYLAFVSQSILGVALSLFGAPMCAWLVESFEPDARLTSIAIGYNVAQAIAGGITPFLATVMVGNVGRGSPGWILTALAVISLTGLRFVARLPPATGDRSGKPNNFIPVHTANNVPEGATCEMVGTAARAFDDDENDLL